MILYLSNIAKISPIYAIIGNPPYQVVSENTSDAPVYHLFIDLASQLTQRVSLITPARYLFDAGKTPKEWNAKVLQDEHFKVVNYWANSTEVFPTVDIKGGVAVMYRDSKQNFGKIGTFTAYPELTRIANKVVSMSESGAFANLIYSPESYRLSDKLHTDFPWVVDRLSKGHPYDITTNIFDKLPDIFRKERLTNEDEVRFYGRYKNERCYRWVKRDYIECHPNLDKYKVIVPKSNGSGVIGEVLSTPIIGEPLMGVTQTFLTIGAFDTQSEAEACLKYIKTKFARTMLGILKATQDNKKETWRLVPLQDFTADSDIDWRMSVADIDRQLYRKYGLEEKEITFIEEKVRTME